MIFLRPGCFILLASLTGIACALTAQECAVKFAKLRFDNSDFARYTEFYDEDSTFTLANVGTYRGPEDIEEYVRFGSSTSPYIVASKSIAGKNKLVGFDPVAKTCTFQILDVTEIETTNTTARPVLIRRGAILKATYSAQKNKVTTVLLFFKLPYVEFYFKTVLGSLRTASYICRTLRDSCKRVYKYNGSPSLPRCVRKLRRQPLFTSGKYADGLDLSRRVVHAVFARTNPVHCAHISFLPLNDPNGQLKCQKSELIPIGTGFAASDMDDFNCFLKSNAIDAEKGYKIECHDAKNWRLYWLPDTSDVCKIVRRKPQILCRMRHAEIVCAATCSRQCKKRFSRM